MLINLRNALMTGKRTPTAKDYVQNGLVAMWDGIENAGWGTHDASATTWKDLVGNLDLTIYGNVKNNCVETIDTAAAEANTRVYGIATIETYFTLTGFKGNNKQGIVFYSGPIDTTYPGIVAYGPDIGVQTFSGTFWSYPSIASINKSTITATSSGCYVNGSQLSSATHAADAWSNGGRTGIGGRAWQNNWQAFGSYYCVRLYSRVLTASEIAANYAIDKARFGLP